MIGGDGTGPKVTAEAVKVLKAVGKLEKIELQFDSFDIGGERYLKKGITITEDEVAKLRWYSSILLGAKCSKSYRCTAMILHNVP